MQLSDDELCGRTVITADGTVLGDVKRVFFDTDGWRVASLLVELRTDAATQIGATRSVFRAATLEVPIRAIQSVGDAVVLTLPLAKLRGSAPVDSPETSAGSVVT